LGSISGELSIELINSPPFGVIHHWNQLTRTQKLCNFGARSVIQSWELMHGYSRLAQENILAGWTVLLKATIGQ
jgi:hypothetical protein